MTDEELKFCPVCSTGFADGDREAFIEIQNVLRVTIDDMKKADAEVDRLRAENARQAETIAKLREIADDALDIAEEYAGEERGASIDVLREALKESEG